MRRGSLLCLEVGGLLILISLYLPWWQSPGLSKQYSFVGRETIDGWHGRPAALAALAAASLAVLAVVALARPELAARLPLRQVAALAVFYGVAVGVETRSFVRISSQTGVHFHLAYGAFVCGIGVVVAFVGGAALGPPALEGRLLTALVAAALLSTLLLPWAAYTWGVSITALLVAAALTVRVAAARGREQLLLACATLVLVAAAFQPIQPAPSYRYGAWLGLAAALLLPVAAWRMSGIRKPRRPTGAWLVVAAPGALLVTSLFLPWQRECVPEGCYAFDNWGIVGSTAALLTLALVFGTLRRRLPVSPLELAVAIGVLVATLGFRLEWRHAPALRLDVGYGAFLGFASAAALLVVVFARRARSRDEMPRIQAAAVPMLAAGLYVVYVVAQSVYDIHLARFSSLGWLAVAGVLIALHLLFAWQRWARGVEAQPNVLVGGPLALIALVLIQLAPFHYVGWGSGIVLGLSFVLLLCGWAERSQRAGRPAIPELLRVDRL